MKTNIASERVKLGLSQEQLGKLIGVSRDVVSNWETGDSSPSVKHAITMADAFGCSIEYLFCLTEDRLFRADSRAEKFSIPS